MFMDKRNKKNYVTAIIAAAGKGERFGGGIPKQFALVEGKPLLTYTLEVFDKTDAVTDIVVTVPDGYVETTWDKVIHPYNIMKVKLVVEGGKTRQASVCAALKQINANTDIVLIHDGARPYATETLINKMIGCASEGFAAVPGYLVTDTVKIASMGGFVEHTPDRRKVWLVQTPQAFPKDIIINAHERAEASGFYGPDDASLVEAFEGVRVKIVPGDVSNIKITTPSDLATHETQGDGSLVLRFLTQENRPLVLENRPLVLRPLDTPSTPYDVEIYTDGACTGNPGPGGYGSVIMYAGTGQKVHRKELSKGYKHTTNNRMEIMGVIAALEALVKPCKVVLYSDSKYVVEAIEKGWVKRWQNNNWMRNKKDIAINSDLWQRLMPLLDTHNVEFRWVKGHSGIEENELCDRLAQAAAADTETWEIDDGYNLSDEI